MSATKHKPGHQGTDQGGADTNALAAAPNNAGVTPDTGGTPILDSLTETYAYSEDPFGGGPGLPFAYQERQARKKFFSEEKNQKTFVSSLI